MAIQAWFLYPKDFRSAVMAVIKCGGDTDSTAAIVGGIVGATVGNAGIPAEWIDGLRDWPRSVAWMERLGAQLPTNLESNSKSCPISLPIWGVMPRNLFFLVIVLWHGFRRIFPPY